MTLPGARRAYLVYLGQEAAGSFCFMMVITASGLFMIQDAHLDALQLVLVGTTLELSAFLFEVPTGVLADTVSRRLSVIIGTALIGAGLIVWGAWTLFATILVGQVLWGIGFTFTSGATQAWISDETGNVETGRIYVRGAQLGWLAGALGIVASVPLTAAWGLQAPMLAGGIGYLVMAVALVAFMPERHWSPAPREGRSVLRSMGDTLRRAAVTLRLVPALLTILAISFVASVPLTAAWGLQAPMLAGGIGYLVMTVALIAFMPERHWSPAPREGRSVLRSMGDTLSRAATTLRIVPALLTILAISFVAGAGSEAFDRLRELHILANFPLPVAPQLPVIAWFALINLVSLAASIVAVEVARRRLDTESHVGAARTLLILHLLLIGMVLAFALAVSFEMAALSYLVTRIVRRVAMPIASAWINLGLTSDVRATVHSMNSQADALGQIAGGPLLGWLALAAGSTRPAMLAVALILVPSLYLYLRTIRLHGRDLVVDETAA